jgi:cytochrome c nitrite reductase small subunit
MDKRNKGIFLSIVVAGIIVIVSLFFMFGPPQLLAKSDEPDFCVSCHVMEAEYEAWVHTGAHRRNKCVDCHLPNHNMTAHYVWKAIDGLKDVAFFYSGNVPERIQLTSHGEKVLKANCIRCHETTVMLIDTDRQCWDCHKRISHKNSGAIATL